MKNEDVKKLNYLSSHLLMFDLNNDHDTCAKLFHNENLLLLKCFLSNLQKEGKVDE